MPSRRSFLFGLGVAAVPSAWRAAAAAAGSSGFKLSVITDEISQDFAHACDVAAREFGLGWVEIRAMNNKNVINWDAKDIAEAKGILQRYNLRVSEIASPVFKTDWPGAPKSEFSPKNPQYGADFPYQQQDELLERAFALAKAFDNPPIRIFDFWRLADQKPHREAIDDRIRKAAVLAAKNGAILTIENELACNTATGVEAGRLLNAVKEKALMVNWDPGNAAARGEKPFPVGYAALPKNRIAHMHLKDVVDQGNGKTEWAQMGAGAIDYVGQFKALKRDGYNGALSLETHWRGGGSPEESTRKCMAGLKSLLQRAETDGTKERN
jgi:sugar phosphate isomerase/epimerase